MWYETGSVEHRAAVPDRSRLTPTRNTTQVRCYADLGRVEDALGLIAARREAGQPPRLRNYSPVLQRLWRDGDDAAASRMWQELVGAGVAVTEEVIIGMLECYAARGRDRWGGAWGGNDGCAVGTVT
jgi:hypothetical protein